MSHFEIHEDVENHFKDKVKQKVFGDRAKEHNSKKGDAENRVVLQPMTNGVVRRETKRVKLNNHFVEEKKNDNIKDKFDLEVPEIVLNSKDCVSSNVIGFTEYRQDIWKHLYELEIFYPALKSNYMLKQSDLNWNTRSILVDWLASVSEQYKLCNQTFHLSVNFVDRFLCHISVVRHKFQLVGAAAMLLAGKIEEIYPIESKEWSYLTGDAFTVRQILKMEQLIAKVLKYRMQPPTICNFIEHFCTEHNLDAKTSNLAMYLSDLVLLEGDEYLNHMPSKLAAASIALARYILNKDNTWPAKFKKASGYSLKQLSPVVERQHRTFRDSPIKKQQAIQTKYKSEKYQKVALIKPKALALEFFDEDDD